MKRPEKEAVVAQLTDKFRNADAIYLTEYRGLILLTVHLIHLHQVFDDAVDRSVYRRFA